MLYFMQSLKRTFYAALKIPEYRRSCGHSGWASKDRAFQGRGDTGLLASGGNCKPLTRRKAFLTSLLGRTHPGLHVLWAAA